MVTMSLTNGVRIASLAVVAFTVRPAIASSTPNQDPLRVQVSAIASHLTHFATHAIVVNRLLDEREIPSGLVAEQAQLLRDLYDLSGHPEELHRLIGDPDPRIRTIALGALFVCENPQELPYIASLVGDHAATFLDLHDSMNQAPGVRPLSELEAPQTVGQVASALIQFYLEAAHERSAVHANGYPMREADLTTGFDRYWAERKGRSHCASWFLVKLERATRETGPVQPQYEEDIERVLAQIQGLPSPDREWTFLYALFGALPPGPDYAVSETALVYVAKAIGPDDLMKFLLLQPFSTDPDLRFTQVDPRGEVLFPITAFILHHAPQLLQAGDAPALRANASNNPQRFQGSISLWIAASDWLLAIENPTRGAAQLKADFSLFPPTDHPWSQTNQMPLAVILWRMAGAGDKKFLVDWFYGLSPRQEPSLGQDFLRSVDAYARPDTPDLLTAIVADPRFDNTNWSVLAQLLESAGGSRNTPLVPSEEIYSYMPNQFRSDEARVFAKWRNVLRRHYELQEHPPSIAH